MLDDVVVTDALPDGSGFVSAAAPCAMTTAGTVACAVGSLAPGETRDLTVRTVVGQDAPASIANLASATATA